MQKGHTDLTKSEDKMLSILYALPLGIHMYRLEPDGRLVFIGANPAADRILGVDNSIFIGKTIEEAFPPLKATEVPQCYREAAASGKAWTTELIEYHDAGIKGAFEVHAFQTAPNTIAVAFEDITKRKQAEIAVQNSEEKYRRLYNETPVLLHSIDMDGIMVDVNEYWLKTMGYERSEVIGRKITDFYTDASRKHFHEVVKPTFLRNGIAKDISYQFIKKNGELLDVLLSATAERDAVGNVVRSQAVIVDVTEQKRAEELLLRREERYRLLYEGTPVMMHSINSEGKLISVSNQWLKTLGYTRDEVLGRRSTEFLDEKSTAYARDIILPDFMRTGICTDVPYTFIKKNGEKVFTLLSAIAERDYAGKIARSLAVIIDITERKQAQEKLIEGEARFRGLVEHSPLAISIIDRSGRIEYLNKKHIELVGYAVEDVPTLDAWWAQVYPDEKTRQRMATAWEGTARRILSGEDIGAIERTIVGKDGSSKDVEMRFSLVGDKILAVFADISERKKLEQEIIKTQKLESIGALAGGIAHDFNNLLQGIFGYISLAKMTIQQKDKALAMLDQAEKALHQSVNLTTQLLTFSKGGKPLKKVFNLRPMIEEAVRFSLSGSSVDHSLLIDKDIWPVDADEGQIAQVIQNIVINAEQSMPLGGRIEIIARNTAAGTVAGLPNDLQGNLVEIIVRDQGTGIAPEHLPRIFDPYFTTKEKGSGLGLATSYSIIRNHGGVIEVSSELAKGSTFTICLLASQTDAEEQSPSSLSFFKGPKGRILVMDDERMVRDVAGALINSLGHEVAFAEHGESAITQYRDAMDAGKPFDMVMLDLTIKGGLGGLETLQKLLEIDPEVKALVSSGYSDDSSMSDYLSKGFKACLKKPYTIENLSTVLNDMLALG